MSFLIGSFHVLLVVLAMSGIDKILRPAGASAAMRSAELLPSWLTSRRRSDLVARLLGSVELGTVGAVVILSERGDTSQASWIAATGGGAVAAIFFGFLWFVHRLVSHDSAADCGCFGPSSTPPGPAHQWFNLAAVAVAGGTAVVGAATATSPAITLVTHQGVGPAALYIVLVVVAGLVFLLAPSLLADLRPPTHQSGTGATMATEFAITGKLSR